MTRNLGDTLHRENGVRVNQINPGWVLTETEVARKRSHGLADDWYKESTEQFTHRRKNFEAERNCCRCYLLARR